MAVVIESPVETAIGAAVLAVAVGFGVYAAQSDGVSSSSGAEHAISAKFSSVNGVSAGIDVRIAGVKIGRVAEVKLDPATYKALVVMNIDKSIEITKDAIAKVDVEGLLGSTFIAIDPGGHDVLLKDGGVITNTQPSVSLLELLAKFATGGDKDAGKK
ncbi:MAG: outer membrane lipid asymmetry maintenance protein MlaD [Neomegalonema sp.]|nr:outer membrane lipid asymmetry maintenance protein MlaD [Neomegalonema sp.]